ncbi:unnamed protein product [Gadus morhua 'NCC']
MRRVVEELMVLILVLEEKHWSLFHFAAVRPSASPPSLAGSERRTDRSRTDGRTDTPSLPAMGAETGLRRSWALLAFLGVAVASRWGAAAAEVYTNTWAVRVIGGAGEADRIARKHGFVNHGNDIHLPVAGAAAVMASPAVGAPLKGEFSSSNAAFHRSPGAGVSSGLPRLPVFCSFPSAFLQRVTGSPADEKPSVRLTPLGLAVWM